MFCFVPYYRLPLNEASKLELPPKHCINTGGDGQLLEGGFRDVLRGFDFYDFTRFSEISHENEIIWFQGEVQSISCPPLVPTATIT